MKITIELPSYGKAYSVEVVDNDDLDINQVFANLIIPALRAQGYHNVTIFSPLREDWIEYDHFVDRQL